MFFISVTLKHKMATIKTVILLCFAAVFVGAQIVGKVITLIFSTYTIITCARINFIDVANSGERITGGSPAVQGQFKWHAGIRYNFDNGSYQFFQNGALISNQWVLTLSTVVYEYEYVFNSQLSTKSKPISSLPEVMIFK